LTKPEAEFFDSESFPLKKKQKPEILSFLNFSRNQNQRLLKNNHPTLVQTMGRRLTFNSGLLVCFTPPTNEFSTPTLVASCDICRNQH
jgi:hypothetical protein